MWGEFVFHLYNENFIRLASMLDYAAAHPAVRIHVRLHASVGNAGPHAWLDQLLRVFKIDPSRAVWGAISARIAHIPEGEPCGEPYAQPQLLLRETLRDLLDMRAVVDVWGDGRAVAYGYSHGTDSAPARMAGEGGRYVASLHACIARRYAEYSGGGGGSSVHPLLPLMDRAAAEETKRVYTARPPGTPPLPKVVLIERQGSRAVSNAAELRAALATLPINLVVFSGEGGQADNLRDFSNADVVVGPHGAGQTNAIICWPGSAQVEFIPESGLSNLVYTQAALLLGQAFTSFTDGSYYGNIRVDAARVKDAVAALLKER